MLASDDLNRLIINMTKSPALVCDVTGLFESIIDTAEYSRWLDLFQFEETPFRIPFRIPNQGLNNNRILERLGIVRDDVLQVKIHKYHGRLFLTDGLWVNGQFRVFPFFDESQRLTDYTKTNSLDNWADTLIDPATGCGHHPIALSNITSRTGFDINTRAIAFSRINSIINNSENYAIGINNIRDNIPNIITKHVSGKVLFLINMPFALSPIPNVLPLSADGGRTGADLTFSAIDMVKNFTNSNKNADSIKACILNYTVCDPANDRWETVDYAKNAFGSDNVKWTVLSDELMWRVNGRKEQSNPMDIEKICLKADCRFYVADPSKRETVREGYGMLTQSLKNAGWKKLAYGVIEIRAR